MMARSVTPPSAAAVASPDASGSGIQKLETHAARRGSRADRDQHIRLAVAVIPMVNLNKAVSAGNTLPAGHAGRVRESCR
jgi:hypothetical protein